MAIRANLLCRCWEADDARASERRAVESEFSERATRLNEAEIAAQRAKALEAGSIPSVEENVADVMAERARRDAEVGARFDRKEAQMSPPPKTLQDCVPADGKPNEPNWVGIVIGSALVVIGLAMTFIGLGFGAELEPAGFFIAGAGALLTATGAELITQSLGRLRPSWWPEHILNIPTR